MVKLVAKNRIHGKQPLAAVFIHGTFLAGSGDLGEHMYFITSLGPGQRQFLLLSNCSKKEPVLLFKD